MTPHTIKKICVFCGSSPGNHPDYLKAARELAKNLVKHSISLVYGGASVGIMGELADTVLQHGGEVFGVMPQSLVEKEVAHSNLTKLKVTSSMHERKALMAEMADGFIALPGGMGTLEELFEVLTWCQLGFHRKPCGLLNTRNYYKHLSVFLEHAVHEQFIQDIHLNMLQIEQDPAKLLDSMRTSRPLIVDKWAQFNN